jgi:hypothetical protein
MSTQVAVKGIHELITPEVRQAILDNGVEFAEAINAAFAPFEVTFEQGLSLSAMCKKSPQYIALEKAGKKGEASGFVNRVKSTAKACYLGEQAVTDAIVNGFWARFNGTTADKKTGELKQTNISFMAPNLKASKLDDEMARNAREAIRDAKIAKYELLLKTHNIDVEVKPIA